MNYSIIKNCRVCLEAGSMISIFHERRSFKISTKIQSLSGIIIDPDDGLPNIICRKCLKKLENCVSFIQLCQDSDLKLRSLLKNQREYQQHLDEISSESDSINNLQIDEDNIEEKVSLNEYEILKIETATKEIDLSVVENGTETEEIDLSVVENEESIEKKASRKAIKQQCFTCGKVMSSRFRLKMHLRTHTGERPFSCTHCSKTFTLAQNLKVHIRIHTGEKPLKCVECGASFAHSAGLAAHRRKHSGAAPYACRLCPRRFRTGGHLQYHLRRHTGEKKFECNTCGRAFITRSDLKQHLLAHTGDKPHVCCICGLRVTRAAHLRRHMQFKHNGDNPFSCAEPECCAKFMKKTDLDKHKILHDKNVEEKP